MELFIRTIGIKRAAAKIRLANLACNMHRLIFHERRATSSQKSLQSRQILRRPSKPANVSRLTEVVVPRLTSLFLAL